MKQIVRDVGCSFGYAVWALLLIAVVAGGLFAFNSVLYPWWLSVQRESVENSKSYNDSRNSQLFTYMSEYKDLESKIAENESNLPAVTAYRGQQGAILDSMCQIVGTMNSETVSPDIVAFLFQYGGC